MAKAGEKVRKRGLGLIGETGPLGPIGAKIDPLQKGIQKGAERLDTQLQRKGVFFESNLAEAQREAEAAKKTQEESIARQRQRETLRLAEAESEIGRKKLLRRTGGRRSLIASR